MTGVEPTMDPEKGVFPPLLWIEYLLPPAKVALKHGRPPKLLLAPNASVSPRSRMSLGSYLFWALVAGGCLWAVGLLLACVFALAAEYLSSPGTYIFLVGESFAFGGLRWASRQNRRLLHEMYEVFDPAD